jgi:hypothetical protein
MSELKNIYSKLLNLSQKSGLGPCSTHRVRLNEKSLGYDLEGTITIGSTGWFWIVTIRPEVRTVRIR